MKNECNIAHKQGSCVTRIDNLSVKVRGLDILKEVSLTLPCGCFAALIGPNGAGKSTLIRSLVGEVKYQGKISFNNKAEFPKIGYVSQKLFFEADNPCTVIDLFSLVFKKTPVWLARTQSIKPFVEEALATVKAENLVTRPLSALSGGELRRVFLALALARKPQILLLDEAGTGLDQNGLELFYDLLANIRKEYDLSILMVSHNFELVEHYVDYAYLLKAGQLIDEGIPSVLLKREPFLSMFKVNV